MRRPITDPGRLICGPIYTPEGAARARAEWHEQQRKRRTGRPSPVFDVGTVKRFMEGVILGMYYGECCQRAGITLATFYRWMKKGKTREIGDPYRDFRDEFLKARLQARDRAMACWQSAIKAGDWRAAAQFMERRFPEKWGRRRVEMTGKDGERLPGSTVVIGGVSVNLEMKLSEEEGKRVKLRNAIQGLLNEAMTEAEKKARA